MIEKFRWPDGQEHALLDQVQVRLLERDELEQANQLLDQHHYLKSVKPVGERLCHGRQSNLCQQWLIRRESSQHYPGLELSSDSRFMNWL